MRLVRGSVRCAGPRLGGVQLCHGPSPGQSLWAACPRSRLTVTTTTATAATTATICSRSTARRPLHATIPPPPPRRHLSLFGTPLPVHYVDLPPTYEDAVGLPFRRQGDLDRAAVTAVFGPGMNVAAANRLLRILQGRRVAGTLDDPALRGTTAGYPAGEIAAALAYLRRTVPVDEVMNAGLRAEDELAAMQAGEEVDEKPSENKNKNKNAPTISASERKWQARLFKDAPTDDVYGVGAFDAIRARNRLRAEEREQLRQAEQERRDAEAAALAAAERAERGERGELVAEQDQQETTAVGHARPMSPRMQRWALAATSPLQEAPQMAAWQRLWPSAALAGVVVVGGAVLAAWYEPPAPEQRLLPAVAPATATVGALVAANVAVFVLWRIPPAWRLLNRLAIVVPATPRPLSLLGAMFSHQRAGHLLANVAFVWFVGTRLHEDVGRAAFLETYVASGTLAFLASLANIVLRGNLHLTTLGASGAIYGIATAYFVLHKYEGFKILGLPPDPYTGVQGLGFVGLLLGLNLLTLRAEKQAIDVVTHFAGMAVGACFGEYFYRKKLADEQHEASKRPDVVM